MIIFAYVSVCACVYSLPFSCRLAIREWLGDLDCLPSAL